jgi:6-pyruvoyltetrahydropterin/6-carboxytetrahydropterin synthase
MAVNNVLFVPPWLQQHMPMSISSFVTRSAYDTHHFNHLHRHKIPYSLTTLQRTVRFAINPPSTPGKRDWRNGKSGVPAVIGLGRWFEFTVECKGEPDATTGYLVDIRTIDRAVRASVGPTMVAVIWQVTPYYWVRMATDITNQVRIAQRFEFAAAHRLHSPALSDAQNLQTYGRCNNPAGHGHNYQVEPVVEITLSDDGSQPFTLIDLERCAGTTIIDRFDHKHLNTDVPEFTDRIPSVELIARTSFDLLAPVIESESGGSARLAQITVWETEKTSATYPG